MGGSAADCRCPTWRGCWRVKGQGLRALSPETQRTAFRGVSCLGREAWHQALIYRINLLWNYVIGLSLSIPAFHSSGLRGTFGCFGYVQTLHLFQVSRAPLRVVGVASAQRVPHLLPGSRSLTPAPPPFSAMNSMPPASKARRIASKFGRVIDGSPSAASARLTVESPTLLRSANTSDDQRR